jgi:Kdo2-lipid IVA lauroyltransferase/acyltransferase
VNTQRRTRFLIWASKTLARLPYHLQVTIGHWLGRRLLKKNHTRVQIAKTNIDRCFPQLSEEQRQSILEKNILDTSLGIVETATSCFTPYSRLKRLARIHGIEHIRAAQAEKRPVILLTFHQTTLELGINLLGHAIHLSGMYRPHDNAFIEHVIAESRKTFFNELIPKQNIRKAIQVLKQGTPLIYAPDQNISMAKCEFCDFFGIPASYTTATSRMVKLTNAVVIPFTQQRLEHYAGIELTLHPALEIDGEDHYQDQHSIHQFLEEYLSQHPASYLWTHKRFATRPVGEIEFYTYPKRKWKQASVQKWFNWTENQQVIAELSNATVYQFDPHRLAVKCQSTEQAETFQNKVALLAKSNGYIPAPKLLYLSPNGNRFVLFQLNVSFEAEYDQVNAKILLKTEQASWQLPLQSLNEESFIN